ncbi:hypothetical protein GGI25_005821 [Coemansia spiralis]|uniref:Exocyst complex component Sec3 PIP2-binding N-terminal domain-containing protein n=2 Tax=Coemansia TaxID=4863 RepID=A0A9W8KVR9_9FUNG|nr:exocyst complex component Sec3-domain-containing protein [Coemansia spiralis]KAJ1987356.1 hypothetical protein EDC05_005893 [Coemansia umbellata]KAJ2619240.1 hypothetical protein GGI26_005981 [Coemansia sp. RSA 1358]KAJ2670465.1 hypothetical protein GGI25_005821 [Coemansia spiralis]
MASKTETAKVKAIADLLRQQLFIGVEATNAQESAAKASSGGQQPRRERLLNVVNVMERDNSKGSGPAKPRLLCITVKRNRKLRLHKVKMNNNVAEISKTWSVDDVKSIEFKEPTRFSLQLNHKYDFTSTDAVLVEGFVQMLVNFCNKYAIKPPRYINTVSGAVASGPSGSAGTVRPRTVYGRNTQHHVPGQQAPPAIPSFEAGKIPVENALVSEAPVRPRTNARGHNRTPNDQSALMRRMTKYVADHGGDVSALVPMNAPPPEVHQENNAYVPDEPEEEPEDIEEMMLDEAFMLSADELVSDFGWRANIDAAQLESRLLSELHKLESENVRDMLEADKQVPRLIRELDQAISNLEEMEEMLRFYGLELESMDDDVRKIQMENETLKVEEANQQLLLIEMDKILKTITLSEEELQILRNESLETTDGIERVERVAASLKRMLGSGPNAGIGGLEATHEKMKKYEFYSANFSTRVFDYLKVMFQFKIDGCLNDKGRPVKWGIRLVGGPEQVHKMMIKYAGLTLWLKETKPSADKELQAIYIQCMNSLYANQTKELVDSCRPIFFKQKHDAQSGSGGSIGSGIGSGATGPSGVPSDHAFSTGSSAGAGGSSGPSGRRISLDGISGAAHQVISSAVKGSDSGGSGNVPISGSISGADIQPAEAFAIALENLVANVIAEQNFISDLFHYIPPAHIRAMHRIARDNNTNRASEEMRIKIEENANFYNWVTHKIRPMEHWNMPRPKLDSKDVVSQTVHFGSVKEVKSMLDLLFGSLVTQVDALVDMGTRFDPSQAIGMLVSVSKALDLCNSSDQGFLINVLERCSDKLEAIFQRYITEQARAIEATKFVVKKRMGALPFARVFPKFIAHIENLVGDTGYSARTIADSAYSRISRLIFDTLESLLRDAERNAQQNMDDKDAQKEQLNTHVLLLENMFVLIAGLQAYKANGCKPYFSLTLDSYLDHAQIVQRKVTRAYLKDVLQRPFGRLIAFFDAVERCLAANKDPLQTASLGKSQLKKLIQTHSNSTMRENIKQLSKRVDKHFMNEPKLKPVVWKVVVDEVLSNYQRFVTLLARSYKSTNLSLDFTQTDLKRWLSEL